ncbi:MAG: hypothetical protein WCC00_06600 [Candidatus Aminicenantales bacterium]
MTRTFIAATVLCALLGNVSTAQERIKQDIDWTTVREAFEAYCRLPSADNANTVLAALPDNSSYREGDFEQFAAAFRYIHDGRPFRVLGKLVRKGDRLALRIAFKTMHVSVGGPYDEKWCDLIGRAIRVNPILFLEEFKMSGLERAWLDLISGGYGSADEGYRELSSKEILLRIKALKTVDRSDLSELRDAGITILNSRLEYRSEREILLHGNYDFSTGVSVFKIPEGLGGLG